MTRLSKLLILMAVLALIAVPMMAQEDEGGTGGVIIASNIGDDPASFNPLIGNDSASSDIYQWIYPDIVAVDINSGNVGPGVKGGLALDWEYDETGTILTLNLRDDLFWNDGTPITANDYVWAIDAVQSGETSSPRTNIFAELADGSIGGGSVVSVEALDDYTVQVTFSEANCAALSDINDVAVVPSHIWEELYGGNYAAMDDDPRAIPTVTYGPFKDIEFEPGSRVSLIADQAYSEADLGYVLPSEWVYLSVPNEDVGFERFLAGEITYLGIPLARQSEVRDNSDIFTYEYSANSINFIGYNLADPTNVQPGLDEEGNPIDQGIHPIFGDVRVRQALNHAIDIDSMVDGIMDGNGLRVDTYALPTWWVFSSPEPRAYDPDLAVELLAEAGWSDEDGDGTLECNGCLYAVEVDPEFEGTPFSFALRTNAGNVTRGAIGEITQSQLGDIGIEVDFQAIDFGVLVDTLLGQSFDAIIIGFGGGEVEPDVYQSTYGAANDAPGAGFNFVSYYNAEVEQLIRDGRNPDLTDNCSFEGRAPFYERAQEIFHEELPWTYLFVANVMFATQGYVEGPDPTPFSQLWNIDAWNALAP